MRMASTDAEKFSTRGREFTIFDGSPRDNSNTWAERPDVEFMELCLTMTKRDLVQRWFSEVWENRDMSTFAEMLAPSLENTELLDGLTNPRKDYPVLIEVVHKLAGELRVQILHCMEDGDWTSTRYLLTSDGPDGITPVHAEGIMMIRFEGDKIAELTSRFDAFAFFEQLGQLPADAMPACLAGQALIWD
ncbi:SnoaL-like domain protein [Phaeobacter inhibens]|uniref:SnoaL-like domain protein n=3 Tax=Phaeobacter inhibens TaxID=221822 RepID=A0ABM6RFH3_9RHOB|nr:SnoaL-like domain protein [Phaeobacter inhibens]AUQ95069.1 SnoaL-like domain protein [Phaeobacter inhibens]AUR20334.1 SnoaL-like domain protein [Phaeobacter inhibens]